ncbi:MAG: hypothetical protein J7539_18035 [Niabella sp.]|nr:hypothetical protein [Niabella sp.]
MSAEGSNVYDWPAELDALLADPEHHKLLFENDFIRVLDTLILPGQVTNVHTHKWSASLYVLSWSDFIRYDAGGTIMVDSRKLPETPAAATAIWSGPLPPHALENVGEKELHIISVEIKNSFARP